MQLDILLKKDTIRLPICTSATIQGLLYHAMAEDERYSTYIHNSGKSYNGRYFKLFTFSELKGNYEIEGRNIIFLSQAELSVRSADAYLIQLLFSYFSKNRWVSLANETVEIADLKLNDEHIFDDEIVVYTVSPITVYVTEEDGYTRYFTPYEQQFYNSIVSNAKRKWCSCFGDDSGFCFEIIPVENCNFKKRATQFKDTYITAWHGEFVLKGTPKVLDFLYQTGLGSKNSQGFGMIEIKNDNLFICE